MSDKNESKIRDQLKILSQIKPSAQAADKAVENARRAIEESVSNRGIKRIPLAGTIFKYAAAAVILIGLGFLAGQIAAYRQADMEQLRASVEISLKSSLEPAIKQQLIEQFNQQLQEEITDIYAGVKSELLEQLNNELEDFAEEVIETSSTITDRRLSELVQLIEAARENDRLWVAAALEQIEINRQRDNTRLGNRIVSIASLKNTQNSVEQ